MIAKFTRYVRRNASLNKKKLKGKQLPITESLTTNKIKLLRKTKEKHGVKNVWSVDGCICTK